MCEAAGQAHLIPLENVNSQKGYIEVGANTLKSSSTFQLSTKIMFSQQQKNIFFEKMWEFFWENKAHMFITKYVQIGIFQNSDWSRFLGKSS